jgi:hypothetical protein
VPYVPRELNIDFAWMLSFAHFHREGFRAGVDYVFTYGPLGFLNSSVYEAGLLAPKLVWEFSFKLVVVVLALRRLRELAGRTARGLCALALLLLLVNQSYPDSGYLAAGFLVGAFLVEHAAAPLWVAMGLPLLAVLGLIKFTLFAVGAAIALAVAVSAGAARGAWTLLYFVAAFAAVWLASGQALADLPVYLRRSFVIASGYEEAAAYEGRAVELGLGVPLLVLNGVWIACALKASGRRREPLLVVGLAAVALALSWRHGFVGSGGFHFFAFAGLLPFFLRVPLPTSSGARRARTALLAASVALGSAGLAVANAEEDEPGRVLGAWAVQAGRTVELLGDPRGWRASRERALAELRARYRLPRTGARVGRESVDVFHFEQGVVLLNGLHWRPRPLQSHMTFAPELARLNAEFFEGDAAPRFVLYQHQVLHERAPLLDDAAALRVVLRRYAPVLTERSFLLLERRRGEPAAVAPQVAFEGTAELGRWIDTSAWRGEPLLVRLGLHYTAWGWLRRFLLRAPPLFLEVRTSTGEVRRRQLVRTSAAQGFVLSPWLPTQVHFVAWRSGHQPASVTAFRVVAARGFVHDEVGVTILRDPSLAPASLRELTRYPMLDPQPERVTSPGSVQFAMVHDRIGLVLPPPAEIRYRLAPGSFALEGWFGLIPEGPASAPRAVFSAELVDARGERSTLFGRELDPGSSPADRGAQALRVPFEAGEAGELILRTEPPATGRPDGLPYWAEVRVGPR